MWCDSNIAHLLWSIASESVFFASYVASVSFASRFSSKPWTRKTHIVVYGSLWIIPQLTIQLKKFELSVLFENSGEYLLYTQGILTYKRIRILEPLT